MQIKTFLQKQYSELLQVLSKIGTWQFYLIITITIFLNQNYFEGAILFSGYILMTAFAMPIRYYLFKERPTPKKHTNILEKIKASSFPSMHSARSTYIFLFSLTTQISINVKIFLFLILIGIFQSRIHKKEHDYFDIIAGITLGSVIFTFILNSKIIL